MWWKILLYCYYIIISSLATRKVLDVAWCVLVIGSQTVESYADRVLHKTPPFFWLFYYEYSSVSSDDARTHYNSDIWTYIVVYWGKKCPPSTEVNDVLRPWVAASTIEIPCDFSSLVFWTLSPSKRVHFPLQQCFIPLHTRLVHIVFTFLVLVREHHVAYASRACVYTRNIVKSRFPTSWAPHFIFAIQTC